MKRYIAAYLKQLLQEDKKKPKPAEFDLGSASVTSSKTARRTKTQGVKRKVRYG